MFFVKVCEVGPSFLMVFFIEPIVLTGALVKEERVLFLKKLGLNNPQNVQQGRGFLLNITINIIIFLLINKILRNTFTNTRISQ